MAGRADPEVGGGVSLLFADPAHKTSQLLVSEERLDGVVVAPQFLLAGNQFVNCSMAVAAQRDGFLHLGTRKAFAKPLVGMTRAGNQMMLRGSAAHQSLAQVATGFRRRVGQGRFRFLGKTKGHFFSRSNAAAVIVKTPVRSVGSTSG